MNKETEIDFDAFAKSFLKVRNLSESKMYLTDLFSKNEIKVLILRYKIAKMLFEGIPYVDIERQTGASSATIARISESLKYGNDGLRQILERAKRKNG